MRINGFSSARWGVCEIVIYQHRRGAGVRFKTREVYAKASAATSAVSSKK